MTPENINKSKTILRHLVWMFFSLKGRLAPRHYWIGLILLAVLRSPFTFILSDHRFSISFPNEFLSKAFAYFLLSLLLAYSWAFIAMLAKRCHDFGFSGWWALLPSIIGGTLYFVPYPLRVTVMFLAGVPVLLAGLFPSASGENLYGLGPVALEEKVGDKMPCDNRPKMELLEDLYHSGAITEEEYEKRRREMLGLG